MFAAKIQMHKFITHMLPNDNLVSPNLVLELLHAHLELEWGKSELKDVIIFDAEVIGSCVNDM